MEVKRFIWLPALAFIIAAVYMFPIPEAFGTATAGDWIWSGLTVAAGLISGWSLGRFRDSLNMKNQVRFAAIFGASIGLLIAIWLL